MLADRRARAPRPGVGQEREVVAGGKAERSGLVGRDRERAELHEMVAAAARAELEPRAVAEPLRHRRDAPVLVEHGVLPRPRPRDAVVPPELSPDAEPRLGFEGRGQPIRLRVEPQRGEVEDRQLHPAGDVHAHGVGHHRLLGGQDTADRQTVADVGVGHERACHRDRQPHRRLHLGHRRGVDVHAPLSPWNGLVARPQRGERGRLGRTQFRERGRERAEVRIGGERLGRGDDPRQDATGIVGGDARATRLAHHHAGTRDERPRDSQAGDGLGVHARPRPVARGTLPSGMAVSPCSGASTGDGGSPCTATRA